LRTPNKQRLLFWNFLRQNKLGDDVKAVGLNDGLSASVVQSKLGQQCATGRVNLHYRAAWWEEDLQRCQRSILHQRKQVRLQRNGADQQAIKWFMKFANAKALHYQSVTIP